ncbi:hypothetical protein D9M68_757840 [compost metagenome]
MPTDSAALMRWLSSLSVNSTMGRGAFWVETQTCSMVSRAADSEAMISMSGWVAVITSGKCRSASTIWISLKPALTSPLRMVSTLSGLASRGSRTSRIRSGRPAAAGAGVDGDGGGWRRVMASFCCSAPCKIRAGCGADHAALPWCSVVAGPPGFIVCRRTQPTARGVSCCPAAPGASAGDAAMHNPASRPRNRSEKIWRDA